MTERACDGWRIASEVRIEQDDGPFPDVPEHAMKIPQTPQRTSMSEELDRELEEELKKVKEFKPAAKLEIPKEAPVKPIPRRQRVLSPPPR